MWKITENSFDPKRLRHFETALTQGNGYVGTRATFDEHYPGEQRTTFVHGVFDDVPVVFTHLVNFPDWTALDIILAGERFSLAEGKLLEYRRRLNLHNGVLTRFVRWESPQGHVSKLIFSRFASLANQHLLCQRVLITPENYSGEVRIESRLDAGTDTMRYQQWNWLDQGVEDGSIWLRLQTSATKIEAAMAQKVFFSGGSEAEILMPNVVKMPSICTSCQAETGQTIYFEKFSSLCTSRECEDPKSGSLSILAEMAQEPWEAAYAANEQAWQKEWDRNDVLIEGDAEAQLALRFSIYHLLIAAPRTDEQVNIGAKTLSGYGYHGHAFWDTEIFMLPFFTFTRPEIARNLLSYRYHNLPGAREKALEGGFQGAQFPWESAGDGREVTPTWVPDPADRKSLIRIWTGDIEIHISSDIAFAIVQYWRLSGDDAFMAQRGAEVILDSAKFWASRLEWNPQTSQYHLSNVIGPDEYHDHVDDNAFTNYLTRWHLHTAVALAEWLKTYDAQAASLLFTKLGVDEQSLADWATMADQLYCPGENNQGLIEQFGGYFQRVDALASDFDPRTESVQSILGIEGANASQVLKQPDVMMLMYLLPELFSHETIQANYDYYTPRTDLTFGSSLGPSIQAIMATRLGSQADAYENFMRAARADIEDVRGNASDGIHGASAGGLWQAAVFGFGGLRVEDDYWYVKPHLPAHWKRLQFKFVWRGQEQLVDIRAQEEQS
ncbi:MAG: glycoside hydrolase family 65 protein [Anaerolineaceae bacterium]|jgi:kojibiose phosphorylase|nr:glycoside hydrolase family 65 protein [Anaerolineaceae bacterium]